jgi:hypothetical protein
MPRRERSKPRPNESRTPEELEKEKERVRKLKQTRSESDIGHYGNDNIDRSQALLDALIREHPERDPANTK